MESIRKFYDYENENLRFKTPRATDLFEYRYSFIIQGGKVFCAHKVVFSAVCVSEADTIVVNFTNTFY